MYVNLYNVKSFINEKQGKRSVTISFAFIITCQSVVTWEAKMSVAASWVICYIIINTIFIEIVLLPTSTSYVCGVSILKSDILLTIFTKRLLRSLLLKHFTIVRTIIKHSIIITLLYSNNCC